MQGMKYDLVWDTRHLDTNMQQEVVFEDSLDRFQQVRPQR